MARGQARQILFRIFYSTSFTLGFIILTIFSAVTPSDTIYESYQRNRLIDIFVIAGVHVVTALLAALIYASRIYTNRSVLKDIPKTFMPIEKEDLPGRRVHRLIQECLERSAVIAYQARPRSRRIEHDTINASMRMMALTKTKPRTDQAIHPSWGSVAHPGWSSPASKEWPGLEYASVVDELVDLVEAKAVSLAPIDPLVEPGPDGAPVADPRVFEGFARSASMGMRAYLRHLIDIGMVPENSLTVAFLAAYERARFSSEPTSDDEFQALMRLFAEILRSMMPVELDLLDLEDQSDYQSYAESRSHSESSSLVHRTQSIQAHNGNEDTISDPSTYAASGSVRHHEQPPPRVSEGSARLPPSYEDVRRSPSGSAVAAANGDHRDETANANDQSLHTAPTTAPRSRSRPRPGLRTSSTRMHSAVSRLPFHPNDSGFVHSDTGSLVRHASESQRSRSSRSSRSRNRNRGTGVIRLANAGENHGLGLRQQDDLPYQIQVPQGSDAG